MSGLWTKTLVYLGLREEDDDYDVASGYVPDDEGVQRLDRSLPTQRVERVERVERVDRTSGAGRSAPVDRWEPDDRWAPAPEPVRTDPATHDSGRIARIGSANVHPLRPEEPPARPVVIPTGNLSVRIVQVADFEDCESIGSRYRLMQPVLFDSSGVDAAIARRVLDFVSGLTYVSHGTLRKVGKRSFLLVPDGVQLPLEERRRLDDLGYELPPEWRP